MNSRVVILIAIILASHGIATSQSTGPGIPSRKTSQVNWVNLQWPPQSNIAVGGSVTVYVRCHEAGVTEPAGADPRISVWVGYSSSNTHPNTWTTWQPAAFNTQHGNADEYQATIGSAIPAGMRYYASRLQFNGGTFQYGGFNAGGGGFWDGISNVSGILAVGKSLATITLSGTIQQNDGNPKQVTAATSPAGLTVKITYDGSSTLPFRTGNYKTEATIVDPVYQGTQTGTLSIWEVPADEESAEFRNRFIWVMYDQVFNQSDLDQALACDPDVISRGWFKWGNWGDFNYNQWTWMTGQSAQKDAMFGGGMTVSVLYPDEVDQEKFLRMVDRDPQNRPMFLNGDSTLGCYLGDFQNKEYLDFVLGWMYRQIDAGAGTLHLDGIAAIPPTNTGYSNLSMGEFNRYLIRKYADQQGWALNDTRWLTVFDIRLSLDCTDGTLNTFDYRKYLKRKGFEKDPLQYNFPLRLEFGVPWNYAGSYCDQRNRDALQYLYGSAKSYAAARGRSVMITMNGYSNFTDYQTMGVWDSWSVTGGRLNISPSYVQHWRDIKEYSLKYLNRDVPLVVFHDWGWGMPFLGEIPPVDQILWLRVYAPEIFASGSIFAWPLSGGGNQYQPAAGVMDTIRSLIGWYSRNRDLYLNSSWVGDEPVDLKGQTDIVQTLSDQFAAPGDRSKRIVHLVNKRLDSNRRLVTRTNMSIGVISESKPRSVWAVSPDYPVAQKLDFAWFGNTADITVKKLDAYAVVVLDYKNNGPVGIETHENGLATVVWPNPVRDFIQIRNNPDKSFPVQLLDILGNVILQGTVPDDRIDLRGIPAGCYILKFRDSAVRLVKLD
jgi:hypothetical protein